MVTHWDIWVSVAVIAVSVWCLQTMKPTGTDQMDSLTDILSILGITCMFFGIIDAICAADDYYKIVIDLGQNSSFVTKVYLYRRASNLYKMTIINTNDFQGYKSVAKSKCMISRYQMQKYGKSYFFLYTLEEDENCWYYLENNIIETTKLGQKIDDTLFLLENYQNNQKGVQVLKGNEVKLFVADECYFDVEIMEEDKQKPQADRYIVLKSKGQYKVYGLYFKNKKTEPSIEETEQKVTFKETAKQITLISDKGVYSAET